MKQRNEYGKEIKAKGKTEFKDLKLATKTSVAIGTILTVMLTLLITVSAIMAKNAVTDAIDGEFSNMAAENGVVTQSILSNAASTAAALQDYLTVQYEIFEKNGYQGEKEKSQIYNIEMEHMNTDIENYILNTAWSTVNNNADIIGVGVFFEPGCFDAAVEDYTIYVGTEDAQKRTAQSYGSYSEYGNIVAYKEAAATGLAYFTPPYTDQGITMITAAFPVLYSGVVQGVVVVDINIDNFSKLKSSDTKYTSMYTDVYMADSTIVYDSESTVYVGQKLTDLLSEKEYSKIQEGINTGKAFDVKTKKDDGTNLVRYYYPVNAQGETWWTSTALNQSDLDKG